VIHDDLIALLTQAQIQKSNYQQVSNLENKLAKQEKALVNQKIPVPKDNDGKNSDGEHREVVKLENPETYKNQCPLCANNVYDDEFINKNIKPEEIENYVKIGAESVPLSNIKEHNMKCMHRRVYEIINKKTNSLMSNLISKIETMDKYFGLINDKCCQNKKILSNDKDKNLRLLEEKHEDQMNFLKVLYASQFMHSCKKYEGQIEYLQNLVEKKNKEIKGLRDDFNSDKDVFGNINRNFNSSNNIYNYITIHYDNPYIVSSEASRKINEEYIAKYANAPCLSNEDHNDKVTEYVVNVDKNGKMGPLKEISCIPDEGIKSRFIVDCSNAALCAAGLNPGNMAQSINNLVNNSGLNNLARMASEGNVFDSDDSDTDSDNNNNNIGNSNDDSDSDSDSDTDIDNYFASRNVNSRGRNSLEMTDNRSPRIKSNSNKIIESRSPINKSNSSKVIENKSTLVKNTTMKQTTNIKK
jgi:hypothetical protein